MHGGLLQQQISIQEPSRVVSDSGQPREEWVSVRLVWAYCRPLTVREKLQAGKLDAETAWKITVRAPCEISNEARIKWQGRIFNLTGSPMETGRQWVTILATETK